MTKYFIAGYSVFKELNIRWDFWRIFEVDNGTSPEDAIMGKVTELETSMDNMRYERDHGYVKGDLIITSFNKL